MFLRTSGPIVLYRRRQSLPRPQRLAHWRLQVLASQAQVAALAAQHERALQERAACECQQTAEAGAGRQCKAELKAAQIELTKARVRSCSLCCLFTYARLWGCQAVAKRTDVALAKCCHVYALSGRFLADLLPSLP